MVSMLVTSVVDCGFYPWSGQTKNWYLLLVNKACSIKENKSKDLLIWSLKICLWTVSLPIVR